MGKDRIEHDDAKIFALLMHMAARWSSMQVAKSRLEKGAIVNAQVMNGYTPLRFAKFNKHDKLINLLQEHGAR